MTHQQATEIILRDSGSHFDPAVVEAFEEIADEVDRIRARLQSVSAAAASPL